MAFVINDEDNANNDEMRQPSNYGDCPLTDYEEALKPLFGSCEDIEINEIEYYLKSEFKDIRSIEPIK